MGGPLECQGGYQARPKIHVIRVVFQDQALYARTSFRGAKTCKIGKKGCVFGHIDKFWKEHDWQTKKNACKNAYLGSFFIPEKYVIRVLFVSPWTSLIPPLAIRVAPPGICAKTKMCYIVTSCSVSCFSLVLLVCIPGGYSSLIWVRICLRKTQSGIHTYTKFPSKTDPSIYQLTTFLSNFDQR